MGVARPLRDQDRVGSRQQVVLDLRHLEVGRRHGQPAVVGDAHLEAGAAVVAEEAGARGAFGAGKHLDAAARKADAGTVEALDDGFLGGPTSGEAVGVAGAVGLLGARVDLVEEAGAGPFDGQRYPVYRDGVNTDPLHQLIVGLPGLTATLERPTWLGSLREPGHPPRMAGR